MRFRRYAILPACIAVLIGSTAIALSCGPEMIKLPTAVQRGIVRGDHFYAITSEGRLLDVDLNTTKVREFSDLGVKLGPRVDARGNTICVSAGKKLLLVDAGTGKIAREVECSTDIRGFGFAADDQIFVQTSANIEVIDLKTGKTVESTPMKTEGFRTVDLLVAGGKAFCVSNINSYGIPLSHVNSLDIKTSKQQYVKLPNISDGTNTGMGHVTSIVAGPDGSLYFTLTEGVVRMDADGKNAAQMHGKNANGLVGFWEGRPVALVNGRTLVFDMPLKTVKSK